MQKRASLLFLFARAWKKKKKSAWAISPNHPFLERSKSHAQRDARHQSTRQGLPDLISGNLQNPSSVSVTRGVKEEAKEEAEEIDER
jgi:hypothetical protein